MNDEIKIHQYEDRQEYIDIQVQRSRDKFGLCKVFLRDILRYRELLSWDYYRGAGSQPLRSTWRPRRILCLGVRSGAENDLFRAGFFGPLLRIHALSNLAAQRDSTKYAGDKIRLAERFGIGAGSRADGRVVGVEINPDASRSDIRVGSFDELPAEWAGEFDLLFSNSFDHSMDPARTVAEWKRVAAPGAYVIVAFAMDQQQSDHDPTTGLTFTTLRELWGEQVVFASETYNRNGYHEICFRMPQK
jgi:hypothetical protein